MRTYSLFEKLMLDRLVDRAQKVDVARPAERLVFHQQRREVVFASPSGALDGDDELRLVRSRSAAHVLLPPRRVGVLRMW